jgi:hypothetical protein
MAYANADNRLVWLNLNSDMGAALRSGGALLAFVFRHPLTSYAIGAQL